MRFPCVYGGGEGACSANVVHPLPNPPPQAQGYRIWASIEVRKASSHPARLILRRMDAVLGCERRVLSASLRRMARFSGPWSLRLRARSSSKTTSRTQCSWFSIPQWARVIASTRAGDHGLDSKKYRTIGGSSASPTRRCSSIRASALIPGKSCLRASPAAGTTTAWRRSSRPWLPVRGCCTCGCSASGSSSICASVNSADWLALSAKAYCPPRWRMHWANSAWQCSASAVTVQPSSASSSKASNAAATSLRLGANRWAIASRASAAHTLTSCSGVVLRPRSNAPRKALPSTATTPCSSLANSARNRRNTGSNACGSSSLNIRLKVSWLGMPCSSRIRHVGAVVRSEQHRRQRNDQNVDQIGPRIVRSGVRHVLEKVLEFLHRTTPPFRFGSRLQNPYRPPAQHRHYGQMRFPCLLPRAHQRYPL